MKKLAFAVAFVVAGCSAQPSTSPQVPLPSFSKHTTDSIPTVHALACGSCMTPFGGGYLVSAGRCQPC